MFYNAFAMAPFIKNEKLFKMSQKTKWAANV